MKNRRRDYHSIFEDIRRLNLGNRYDLNRGGCGCFAELVHEILPDLRIIYMDGSSGKVNEYNSGNASSCSHVVLSDGSWYYDADGRHDPATFKQDSFSFQHRFEVDADYLHESLQHRSLWNDAFDRCWLPEIKEALAHIVKAA